jgi:Tfp pilus assembly protein PilP
MRSAITLGLGIMIAAAAPGVLAQVNPATPNSVKFALQGGAKPAQQPAKPAAKPAAPAATKPQAAKPAAPAVTKPAPQTVKPAAKPAAKPAVKSSAKPVGTAPVKPAAKKKVEKAAAPRTSAPAESEVRMARRDPFESLVGRQQGKGAPNLPPGKAGLQVSTLRLDGIVKAPNGMIAVVSNPQARTYFLREGDHLFDGSVEKISMDGVSFHEEGKDAFGKPMERQVNKRIYSSPGEQQ